MVPLRAAAHGSLGVAGRRGTKGSSTLPCGRCMLYAAKISRTRSSSGKKPTVAATAHGQPTERSQGDEGASGRGRGRRYVRGDDGRAATRPWRSSGTSGTSAAERRDVRRILACPPNLPSRPLFLPPSSLPVCHGIPRGHDLSLSLYCPLSLPLSLSSSLSFLFRSRSSLVPPGLRVSRLLRLPALPPAPSRCVTRSPWLTDCHVALT